MARGYRSETQERDGEATVAFPAVRCIRQTSKAILCVLEGKEVWFPQSHVHADSEVYQQGHKGKLVVSEWIAKEKGLI